MQKNKKCTRNMQNKQKMLKNKDNAKKNAKKKQNMLKLHMQNIKYGRIQNMQTDANRYRKVKNVQKKYAK